MDTSKYDDEKFIRESGISTIQWSLDEPSYVRAYLHVDEVEDDTDYFQVGQTHENTLYSVSDDLPKPSIDNKFPENYRIIAYDFYHSTNKLKIER